MKSFPFSIKDISTHRSELMGWAILWIMMLHFTFNQLKPLGFVAQFGYAGVEIFMFVSGFGLFFSLEKDSQPLRFYKKRLLRIFPTYYILGIFASLLIYHDDLLTYLFRYTTIGFWTGGRYLEWYIPSIVALYILAPFIKWLFDKRQFVLLGTLSCLILMASYFLIDKPEINRLHFFFLYRIPTFIFGMTCAYWLKHGVSAKYYYWILLAGIPLFAVLFPHHHQVYNFKYFAVVFLLPLSVLCFTLISKYARIIAPLLTKMGNASLEIYLIQSMFLYALLHGKLVTPSPAWHDLASVGFIIVSTVLGIAAHRLISWAMHESKAL